MPARLLTKFPFPSTPRIARRSRLVVVVAVMVGMMVITSFALTILFFIARTALTCSPPRVLPCDASAQVIFVHDVLFDTNWLRHLRVAQMLCHRLPDISTLLSNGPMPSPSPSAEETPVVEYRCSPPVSYRSHPHLPPTPFPHFAASHPPTNPPSVDPPTPRCVLTFP